MLHFLFNVGFAFVVAASEFFIPGLVAAVLLGEEQESSTVIVFPRVSIAVLLHRRVVVATNVVAAASLASTLAIVAASLLFSHLRIVGPVVIPTLGVVRAVGPLVIVPLESTQGGIPAAGSASSIICAIVSPVRASGVSATIDPSA